MNLSLSEDCLMVQEMFERFFAAESAPERVRAAEPLGFDPELWQSLLALDAPFLRMSMEAGGSEMGLLEACLMMEEAGRRLASVPLAEAVVALRLLGQIPSDSARALIDQVRGGEHRVAIALQQSHAGQAQWVPGAAVSQHLLHFDGQQLVVEALESVESAAEVLSGTGAGWATPGTAEQEVLATGEEAAALWGAAVEEWKLLTASALTGLALEALKMGAEYATEREAFGKPIGSYQGIGHVLADDVIDTDGARVAIWRALRAIADGEADAGARVSQCFWWAARSATNSVAHSLHTFGGYGLTLEYDIQMYHRRAKAWALVVGDPEQMLLEAARREFMGEACTLPDVGELTLDFSAPDGGEVLAAETRAVFDSVIDPERHVLHDHSFESHAWDVHRALGEAALLFPSWPAEWGGRGADADSARASRRVWQEVGYTPPAAGVTGMVGDAVMKFGSQELKDEVLLRFAKGECTACLGYTEPSGGSDVFACKTRAVRDGDDWIINGQKMFTSGANLAEYVFLITRTDPDAPKHKGITMFLVPLNDPGVEIHPVYTYMDERTNATFYSDVRVPDRYRIGEVNGGVLVMSSALSQEQSGGGTYDRNMREMATAVIEWLSAKSPSGDLADASPSAMIRLAKAHAYANVAEVISAWAMSTRLHGAPDLAWGPAGKIFATEAFITVSTDLIDLAAPDSLHRGKNGLGLVEMGYRHSTATTIYGGTSEVLRSMVAERRLGLPRSR